MQKTARTGRPVFDGQRTVREKSIRAAAMAGGGGGGGGVGCEVRKVALSPVSPLLRDLVIPHPRSRRDAALMLDQPFQRGNRL